jgi:hypothetical protein
MGGWGDLLVNPRAIEAIFGDQLPGLDNLELHEVVVHRDGPSVRVRFDIEEFPSDPPEKWRKAKHNRVQMEIVCVGVSDLSIQGLATNMMVSLSVEGESPNLGIQLTGPATTIEFSAMFVDLSRISAYHDDR